MRHVGFVLLLVGSTFAGRKQLFASDVGDSSSSDKFSGSFELPASFTAIEDEKRGFSSGSDPATAVFGYTKYTTGGCAGRNELGGSEEPTVHACAELCDAESPCVSFEYDKDGTSCYLSTSCNRFDLTVQKESAHMNWFLKDACPVGYTHTTADVKDGDWNVNHNHVKTITACGDMCDADATCSMFEYKDSADRCKVSSGSITADAQSSTWTSCMRASQPGPEEMTTAPNDYQTFSSGSDLATAARGCELSSETRDCGSNQFCKSKFANGFWASFNLENVCTAKLVPGAVCSRNGQCTNGELGNGQCIEIPDTRAGDTFRCV